MVHTFSALGRNLAVDVNSGAVHVLDKLCCDLLSLVEGPMGDACPQDLKDRLSQYDARELDEAWTELLELQRAGLLFSDDDYIDPAAAMALPKAAVVKALCLHVSHDCNLRCRYCFASTGDFGTGHRMTMDFDTAKRAIDWVVEKSGKRRNIEVDFFGAGHRQADGRVRPLPGGKARQVFPLYDHNQRCPAGPGHHRLHQPGDV